MPMPCLCSIHIMSLTFSSQANYFQIISKIISTNLTFRQIEGNYQRVDMCNVWEHRQANRTVTCAASPKTVRSSSSSDDQKKQHQNTTCTVHTISEQMDSIQMTEATNPSHTENVRSAFSWFILVSDRIFLSIRKDIKNKRTNWNGSVARRLFALVSEWNISS